MLFSTLNISSIISSFVIHKQAVIVSKQKLCKCYFIK